MPFKKGHNGYGKKKATPEDTVDMIVQEIGETMKEAPKARETEKEFKIEDLYDYMSPEHAKALLHGIMVFLKNAKPKKQNMFVVTKEKEKE